MDYDGTDTTPTTPLTSIPGLEACLRERLEACWLRSAEEVLSACQPPGAARALKAHLGLDEAGFEMFLEALRTSMPPNRLRALTPPQTRVSGLGLRLPTGSVANPEEPRP